MELGYALSSEEHPPRDLVRHARLAEEAGFRFALISDHFHPWIDKQGHAPFVWSIIGGIAATTDRLRLGTGVTCPFLRTHPVIVAQAAATAAASMPGRFFLGVGTGENLNEHVIGEGWPPLDTRQEMLEEAVEVMRRLWEGELTSHEGVYFTVENARIYTLPDEPPLIMVAAGGPDSAQLAGQIGDGLICTTPKSELVENFKAARNGKKKGGDKRPCYGKLTVCWGKDEAKARKTAHQWWPTSPLPGPLKSELALPSYFEEAAELVTEDMVAEKILCSADPEKHLEKINEFIEAGFEHVYIHQVGPDQQGFIDFYRGEILPEFNDGKKD